MISIYYILILILVSFLIMTAIWTKQIGLTRGLSATLCRILWVLPILLSLFPKIISKEIPNTLKTQLIHVLIDDSESMTQAIKGVHPIDESKKIITQIKKWCKNKSCTLKTSYLSKEDPMTKKGYSPLSLVVPKWLKETSQYPWIIISDGANYQPNISWHTVLEKNYLEIKKNISRKKTKTNLIIGVSSDNSNNLWIEDSDIPNFSFKNKAIYGNVVIKRSSDIEKQVIQLQASNQNKILSTLNVEFAKHQKEAPITIAIPPLPKGKHVITLKILANMTEKVLWDNDYHIPIDVLTNTVGILHLLGEPSWDGRFLRKHLKSEPKYDLVSFFILRDPWDQQPANENELSLIPFPVKKLFTEELKNFHVIILQNFNLKQFLLPEYQQHLVDFVKNGGGLLYIGGNRTLKESDLNHSPLKEIIPFTTPSTNNNLHQYNKLNLKKDLTWYDPTLSFQIKIAQPNDKQRSLANFFNEWESLINSRNITEHMRGIHHMENVILNNDKSTPLLFAQTQTHGKIPLAVASYPNKGRALWIFTDKLWQLAHHNNGHISRGLYNKLLQSATTWLLRQELKQPLTISRLTINNFTDAQLHWTAKIEGEATTYLTESPSKWQFYFCNNKIDIHNIQLTDTGNQSLNITSKTNLNTPFPTDCTLLITGQNKAFGSVKASTTAIIPQSLTDNQLSPLPHKLKQLAQLTNSSFHLLSSQTTSFTSQWLNQNKKLKNIDLPKRHMIYKKHYWIFDSNWIWFLILFLPLEVLIRRWHLLSKA